MTDQNDSFSNPPIASWWTRILAPIFGKKFTDTDEGFTLTAYQFRGVVYITKFTPPKG